MSDGLDATLRAASRGETAAWRILVEQYAPRVFGLLRSRCGDPDLAEELTQSAFCTVAEKLGSDQAGGYVEQGHFESWLFQIAMNRLRDEMRRRKRQAVGTGNDDNNELLTNREDNRETGGIKSFDKHDDQQARFHALRIAMEQLSTADREVIELRHMGGLSYKQIAAVLDEPIGTILARQHRALRKLKGLLHESIELPFS